MADERSTEDASGKGGKKGKDPAPPTEAKAPPRYPPVSYKKLLEIYPDKPLKQYDTGPVKAYAARGLDKLQENFFALVCEPSLTPRIRSVPPYMNFSNPSLAPLVDKGVVYWPPEREERLVFIYRDTLGRKIQEEGQKPALAWRPEEVMDAFVRPMVDILQDFRSRDFVHGSIRPSNIYNGGASDHRGPIILGDCLTLPPSYGQSVLYETIPRGLTDPVARGPGTQADDVYAFGISLAVLLRTNDPLAGLNDDDILRYKIEHGSYIALTGKDRFKGSILELLRGILHDEESERWTIEEIVTWMDGRRLSPKQQAHHKKAPRPLVFQGHKFFSLPLLLMSMENSPHEAAQITESGELDQWIRRSLGEEELAERIEFILHQYAADARGPGYEHKLMARIFSILDKDAPIRYKGLRLRPEGFGYALAETLVKKEDPRAFVEMIKDSVVLHWISSRTEKSLDITSWLSKFENGKSHLRNTKIGFGLERCLYQLCPEIHCLSEKLAGYCVRTSEEMIRAFEKICAEGRASSPFFDRHSAAFLSVADSKTIDPFLFDLGAPEKHKIVMGNLKILAAIQKRYDMEPFPAISKAILGMLPPVYERFHDRQLREKIKKEVERFAEAGSLVKMAATLEDTGTISTDNGGFQSALAEYTALILEERDLGRRLEDSNSFARQTGHYVSALIAGILAMIIVCAVSFLFFTNKSGMY